tara:strand:- start:5166 stop:5555 length:390 start_codon:yes stop_codon:yes gene_type:complete
MEYNNDFKYDLKLGQEGENIIAQLLSDSTIEVKLDFLAHKTDNIFIEYESRGKLSGIATTESKFWFYIILKENTPREEKDITIENVEDILFFKVNKLKDICREWLMFNEGKKGGDSNTSLGCCIPRRLL